MNTPPLVNNNQTITLYKVINLGKDMIWYDMIYTSCKIIHYWYSNDKILSNWEISGGWTYGIFVESGMY